MSIRFDNKVAVITGAGGGLGRSYALYLASQGAKVVVNDLGGKRDGTGRSQSPARKVVEEITASGGEAIANYDDVSKPQGASNIINDAIKNFGAVDILINNAGILRNKTLLKMPIEDFEHVIKVHLLGTVYITKAALPIMREKCYGRIVMTTSNSGLYGTFGQTNYSAAKMGIVGFMNSLKLEEKKYNICVNTIAPLAASRMGAVIFSDELVNTFRPELVTAAVAYLCSEQCTASGDIISAGAGFYFKVHMVEGRGIKFDSSKDVTPDMIAERYAEITNMDGAKPFDSSSEEIKAVFGYSFDV